MSQYQLFGGTPLYGAVAVGGSKNAALPILFAALSVPGVSIIENLPAIADVRMALSLLCELGVEITYEDAHTVRLDTRSAQLMPHCGKLTAALRASTYLLGAELSRFSESRLYDFGGCAFCPRPIDLHLYAIRAFGGCVTDDRVALYRPRAAHIRFPLPSVGATVNALIIASHIPEVTVLENVALEPHVMALVAFLSRAGADISLCGTSMRVRGGRLRGVRFRIIPDMIEAGTYLLAGAITRGRVRVNDVIVDHMASLSRALLQMGADVRVGENYISASAEGGLCPTSVVAAPYPAFPTDLAPIMGALLCTVGGCVTDTVFPERIGYTRALLDMGAQLTCEGGRVDFLSPPTHGASLVASDLRGTAAITLCALAVADRSTLSGAQLLDRGYESFFERLHDLGADVRCIQE